MTQPKVSIIITSYKRSAKPYLDLCIESVKNLDYPKELLETIIVTPESYSPQYEGVALAHPGESYGMPKGLNEGISWASSESEYFFVLNDDVILTKDCLFDLTEHFRRFTQLGLLMPIGNDMQGKYWAPLQRQGPYRIEQLDDPKAMMNAGSPFLPSLILADTLCLYAFLMHRRVWDKVGPFDENLIGQDDLDYSWRTRQAGFMNAIALDSLVWHAGGASNTLTDEQRKESIDIFNKKWNP